MITERQKAFRQEYRLRIVGWYDGYAHILIIYLRDGRRGVLYLRPTHQERDMAGMAYRAGRVFVHEYLRMGGTQIHHASAGQYQGSARHLRTSHAQSSSVLHRQ